MFTRNVKCLQDQHDDDFKGPFGFHPPPPSALAAGHKAWTETLLGINPASQAVKQESFTDACQSEAWEREDERKDTQGAGKAPP